MTALYVAMSVSFCLPHPVAVSGFIICSGLCACTEMVWMCVLYVSFGSKGKAQNLWVRCHAKCSVVYLEVQIDLIVCRVWSEQSAGCFVWI